MGVRQELEDLWWNTRYNFSPGSAVIGLTASAALSVAGAFYLRDGFDSQIRDANSTIVGQNLDIEKLNESINRANQIIGESNKTIVDLRSTLNGQELAVETMNCPSDKTSSIYVDIAEGESVLVRGNTLVTPSKDGIRVTAGDREIFSNKIGGIMEYPDGTEVGVALIKRDLNPPRTYVDGKNHYIIAVDTWCKVIPNP